MIVVSCLMLFTIRSFAVPVIGFLGVESVR